MDGSRKDVYPISRCLPGVVSTEALENQEGGNTTDVMLYMYYLCQ